MPKLFPHTEQIPALGPPRTEEENRFWLTSRLMIACSAPHVPRTLTENINYYTIPPSFPVVKLQNRGFEKKWYCWRPGPNKETLWRSKRPSLSEMDNRLATLARFAPHADKPVVVFVGGVCVSVIVIVIIIIIASLSSLVSICCDTATAMADAPQTSSSVCLHSRLNDTGGRT